MKPILTKSDEFVNKVIHRAIDLSGYLFLDFGDSVTFICVDCEGFRSISTPADVVSELPKWTIINNNIMTEQEWAVYDGVKRREEEKRERHIYNVLKAKYEKL